MLATSPVLSNLTFLSLEYSFIGPTGMQALATSPQLSKLAVLDLRKKTRWAMKARRRWLLRRTWPVLTSLNLRGNIIGDEGASALAAALGRKPPLAFLDLGAATRSTSGSEGGCAACWATSSIFDHHF